MYDQYIGGLRLPLLFSFYKVLEHIPTFIGLLDWGSKIHQLHLCRRVRPPPMCVLNMTLNNLMVNLQGMQSTPLLLSLLGPLWPGVIATDRVLSMIGPYQTV